MDLEGKYLADGLMAFAESPSKRGLRRKKQISIALHSLLLVLKIK